MPKIIGASLAEHRARTRDKLFAALAALMEERGFDSITLAEIATRAGVGRTAVYNHFKDKESLLLGLISHQTADYLTNLQAALAGVTDPIEQLRIYVEQQLSLRASYHWAPGPELRHVVNAETYREFANHGRAVEALLRQILTAAHQAELIPAPELDVLVPLVHSCLAARPIPVEAAARARFILGTELFVMRAVGVANQRAEAAVRPHVEEVHRATAREPVPPRQSQRGRCPVHVSA
ncbi:TetR/AcrR family transcriptional regulator [Buchananella hordeovulneris]|uniref:TetR/AcrR family transcriptional regulator n=1 Tax=Buchananella hordeovulneris TaxID=52770 RepID=UPI0026DBB893|nr:TetR/AcrR family transcriptional regulator [Buchananella hordeovulneris]MDO5080564.1 TetR/AcrR family transcriptional regulator [Buchananella hordeovulneris]